MRYRKLDPQGDYTVDPGAVWLVDTPETVAQAVRTRLKLLAGEWFLDLTEGLDTAQIVGVRTQGTRDLEIKQRILQTKGVRSILAYASRVNSQRRRFVVGALVDTVYGQATVGVSLGGSVRRRSYEVTFDGSELLLANGDGLTADLPPPFP
jgi:hypothetical protein